jgi:hypothetical protein
MDPLNRRDALKIAATGAIAIAGTAATADAQETKKDSFEFLKSEPGKACRLLARVIDGTKAEAKVVPGIINNTFILIVSGKKPYLNMRVLLAPLTYVRQPEYWGIEVLGCIPGIGLPAIGAYSEFLPLDGVLGTKGIEVIWADGTEKIPVP